MISGGLQKAKGRRQKAEAKGKQKTQAMKLRRQLGSLEAGKPGSWEARKLRA
jgi:hypothetical protein